MGRNVNRAEPFGVIPFESIVLSNRLFELVRWHRRLFPKSWLPELLAITTIILIASGCGLKPKHRVSVQMNHADRVGSSGGDVGLSADEIEPHN
jgi:hypothetical protein